MNGFGRSLFDEQRSYIDVNAIQRNPFVFYLEYIDEWQYNCAAIVPGIGNLTFANDRITIGNKSANLMFAGGNLGKESTYCGANSGMSGDGWG